MKSEPNPLTVFAWVLVAVMVMVLVCLLVASAPPTAAPNDLPEVREYPGPMRCYEAPQKPYTNITATLACEPGNFWASPTPETK